MANVNIKHPLVNESDKKTNQEFLFIHKKRQFVWSLFSPSRIHSYGDVSFASEGL